MVGPFGEGTSDEKTDQLLVPSDDSFEGKLGLGKASFPGQPYWPVEYEIPPL